MSNTSAGRAAQVAAQLEVELRDAGRSWLPPEQPLDMPTQDFDAPPSCRLAPRDAGMRWPARAALAVGTLLLTIGFAHELYLVLSFVRITPVQIIFLVLSTLAFAWIALGSLSAAIGLMPLFAGERTDTLEVPPATEPLHHRIALLFPVYHEDCARIAGTIEAMALELSATRRVHHFDVFILSDSRSADAGWQERVSRRSRSAQRVINVYYRRRKQNTAKKAGNIADWVQRFGSGYDSFVVPMPIACRARRWSAGSRLQNNPCAGLIQTVPRLVGGRTIFQSCSSSQLAFMDQPWPPG